MAEKAEPQDTEVYQFRKEEHRVFSRIKSARELMFDAYAFVVKANEMLL